MISCPPPLTHGIERNCISQAACAQNVQTDHSVGRSHSIRLIGVSAHARLTCFHGFMLPCSLFRCWGGSLAWGEGWGADGQKAKAHTAKFLLDGDEIVASAASAAETCDGAEGQAEPDMFMWFAKSVSISMLG